MKNAEPARDIVRRNNSIRDLAWDRLTRDVGRERGDRMRKIKKKEANGTTETGRIAGRRKKATKEEVKRVGIFFGKSLENPSGQLNFIQWRFVPLLRGLPTIYGSGIPILPTISFSSFPLYLAYTFNLVEVTLRMTKHYELKICQHDDVSL